MMLLQLCLRLLRLLRMLLRMLLLWMLPPPPRLRLRRPSRR